MSKGEFDLVVVELSDVISSAVRSINLLNTNDLNASITSTVTRRHLGVELIDRTRQGRITELLVHIMSTTATVVSKPDSVVLDVSRLSLKNLCVYIVCVCGFSMKERSKRRRCLS